MRENPSYCNDCWKIFSIELDVPEAIEFYEKRHICPICKAGRILYVYPPWYPAEDMARETIFKIQVADAELEVRRYRYHPVDVRNVERTVYIVSDFVFVLELQESERYFASPAQEVTLNERTVTVGWEDVVLHVDGKSIDSFTP